MRLTSLGREFGIHVIAATQHPTVEAVGSSIAKANFTMRLVGRAANADAARVAGHKDARFLLGDGDFLAVGAGPDVRLQVALIDERQLCQLPRRETTPKLDLDLDLDRVVDMCDDFDPVPEHVAQQMIAPAGIHALKSQHHIGQAKAQRVRDFADRLLAHLRQRGYTLYPLPDTH